MEQNGVFDNCQSQTRTSKFARPSFVYTVKTFEQAVQMFFRYADSCIGEAEIIEFSSSLKQLIVIWILDPA